MDDKWMNLFLLRTADTWLASISSVALPPSPVMNVLSTGLMHPRRHACYASLKNQEFFNFCSFQS